MERTWNSATTKKKQQMADIKKDSFNKDTQLVTRGTFKPSVRLKPHINELMDSAYHTLQDQLGRLRERSEAGAVLDGKEVRKFAALVDSVAKLARVERENAKAFDPSTLDDKELLEYTEKAMKLLNKENK